MVVTPNEVVHVLQGVILYAHDQLHTIMNHIGRLFSAYGPRFGCWVEISPLPKMST